MPTSLDEKKDAANEKRRNYDSRQLIKLLGWYKNHGRVVERTTDGLSDKYVPDLTPIEKTSGDYESVSAGEVDTSGENDWTTVAPAGPVLNAGDARGSSW